MTIEPQPTRPPAAVPPPGPARRTATAAGTAAAKCPCANGAPFTVATAYCQVRDHLAARRCLGESAIRTQACVSNALAAAYAVCASCNPASTCVTASVQTTHTAPGARMQAAALPKSHVPCPASMVPLPRPRGSNAGPATANGAIAGSAPGFRKEASPESPPTSTTTSASSATAPSSSLPSSSDHTTGANAAEVVGGANGDTPRTAAAEAAVAEGNRAIAMLLASPPGSVLRTQRTGRLLAESLYGLVAAAIAGISEEEGSEKEAECIQKAAAVPLSAGCGSPRCRPRHCLRPSLTCLFRRGGEAVDEVGGRGRDLRQGLPTGGGLPPRAQSAPSTAGVRLPAPQPEANVPAARLSRHELQWVPHGMDAVRRALSADRLRSLLTDFCRQGSRAAAHDGAGRGAQATRATVQAPPAAGAPAAALSASTVDMSVRLSPTGASALGGFGAVSSRFFDESSSRARTLQVDSATLYTTATPATLTTAGAGSSSTTMSSTQPSATPTSVPVQAIAVVDGAAAAVGKKGAPTTGDNDLGGMKHFRPSAAVFAPGGGAGNPLGVNVRPDQLLTSGSRVGALVVRPDAALSPPKSGPAGVMPPAAPTAATAPPVVTEPDSSSSAGGDGANGAAAPAATSKQTSPPPPPSASALASTPSEMGADSELNAVQVTSMSAMSATNLDAILPRAASSMPSSTPTIPTMPPLPTVGAAVGAPSTPSQIDFGKSCLTPPSPSTATGSSGTPSLFPATRSVVLDGTATATSRENAPRAADQFKIQVEPPAPLQATSEVVAAGTKGATKAEGAIQPSSFTHPPLPPLVNVVAGSADIQNQRTMASPLSSPTPAGRHVHSPAAAAAALRRLDFRVNDWTDDPAAVIDRRCQEVVRDIISVREAIRRLEAVRDRHTQVSLQTDIAPAGPQQQAPQQQPSSQPQTSEAAGVVQAPPPFAPNADNAQPASAGESGKVPPSMSQATGQRDETAKVAPAASTSTPAAPPSSSSTTNGSDLAGATATSGVASRSTTNLGSSSVPAASSSFATSSSASASGSTPPGLGFGSTTRKIQQLQSVLSVLHLVQRTMSSWGHKRSADEPNDAAAVLPLIADFGSGIGLSSAASPSGEHRGAVAVGPKRHSPASTGQATSALPGGAPTSGKVDTAPFAAAGALAMKKTDAEEFSPQSARPTSDSVEEEEAPAGPVSPAPVSQPTTSVATAATTSKASSTTTPSPLPGSPPATRLPRPSSSDTGGGFASPPPPPGATDGGESPSMYEGGSLLDAQLVDTDLSSMNNDFGEFGLDDADYMGLQTTPPDALYPRDGLAFDMAAGAPARNETSAAATAAQPSSGPRQEEPNAIRANRVTADGAADGGGGGGGGDDSAKGRLAVPSAHLALAPRREASAAPGAAGSMPAPPTGVVASAPAAVTTQGQPSHPQPTPAVDEEDAPSETGATAGGLSSLNDRRNDSGSSGHGSNDGSAEDVATTATITTTTTTTTQRGSSEVAFFTSHDRAVVASAAGQQQEPLRTHHPVAQLPVDETQMPRVVRAGSNGAFGPARHATDTPSSLATAGTGVPATLPQFQWRVREGGTPIPAGRAGTPEAAADGADGAEAAGGGTTMTGSGGGWFTRAGTGMTLASTPAATPTHQRSSGSNGGQAGHLNNGSFSSSLLAMHRPGQQPVLVAPTVVASKSDTSATTPASDAATASAAASAAGGHSSFTSVTQTVPSVETPSDAGGVAAAAAVGGGVLRTPAPAKTPFQSLDAYAARNGTAPSAAPLQPVAPLRREDAIGVGGDSSPRGGLTVETAHGGDRDASATRGVPGASSTTQHQQQQQQQPVPMRPLTSDGVSRMRQDQEVVVPPPSHFIRRPSSTD